MEHIKNVAVTNLLVLFNGFKIGIRIKEGNSLHCKFWNSLT